MTTNQTTFPSIGSKLKDAHKPRVGCVEVVAHTSPLPDQTEPHAMVLRYWLHGQQAYAYYTVTGEEWHTRLNGQERRWKHISEPIQRHSKRGACTVIIDDLFDDSKPHTDEQKKAVAEWFNRTYR